MTFENATLRYLANCFYRVNMLQLNYCHPRKGMLYLENGIPMSEREYFPVGKLSFIANPGNVLRELLTDLAKFGLKSMEEANFNVFIEQYRWVMQ